MFSDSVSFPISYEDIEELYQRYIFEGETDDDVFTSNEIKKGRSYFFYGKKAFEFKPPSLGKTKLTIFRLDNTKYKLGGTSTSAELLTALKELRDIKQTIFRNLHTEAFGCCNDYIRCSDASKCLHARDRFYTNCMYRKNLEAGTIFYGKNRNV